MTAAQIVEALGLQPHPEGGAFRETFRDEASTAIYFLLRAGQPSARHRVHGRAEVWHWYGGAPLRLFVGDGEVRLGMDLVAGERPQAVVPPGVWQAAETTGAWTLCGCTVAPPFEFAAFEMAVR